MTRNCFKLEFDGELQYLFFDVTDVLLTFTTSRLDMYSLRSSGVILIFLLVVVCTLIRSLSLLESLAVSPSDLEKGTLGGPTLQYTEVPTMTLLRYRIG